MGMATLKKTLESYRLLSSQLAFGNIILSCILQDSVGLNPKKAGLPFCG